MTAVVLSGAPEAPYFFIAAVAIIVAWGAWVAWAVRRDTRDAQARAAVRRERLRTEAHEDARRRFPGGVIR